MPTISVMILTYNHAPYLAQAIESVLMQNTTYKVEIIIIEDCSTDGTQEIIKRYLAKYPDKIQAYMHSENIGGKQSIQPVVFEGFTKLQGDYIAMLEGDDYWSSPDKLHKQVSFLEAHPDFVACAHNTIKIYEDGSKEPHRFLYWEGTKEVHTIHDFVGMTSFFHISSLLFRNMYRLKGGRSFEYIKNRWCCEIYTNMAHTQFGKLHYANEDMSIYRCHKSGGFSNMSETKGRIFNIEGLRRYNRWLGYRYLKGFSFTLHRLCLSLLKETVEGRMPPLTSQQRLRYKKMADRYGNVYDFLDRHPKWDPAVFWYGEPPKVSLPRLQQLQGFSL